MHSFDFVSPAPLPRPVVQSPAGVSYARVVRSASLLWCLGDTHHVPQDLQTSQVRTRCCRRAVHTHVALLRYYRHVSPGAQRTRLCRRWPDLSVRRFVILSGPTVFQWKGKMNGTQTAPEHADIPNEADWALAGIPDSINATELLADDLEEYGGTYAPKV